MLKLCETFESFLATFMQLYQTKYLMPLKSPPLKFSISLNDLQWAAWLTLHTQAIDFWFWFPLPLYLSWNHLYHTPLHWLDFPQAAPKTFRSEPSPVPTNRRGPKSPSWGPSCSSSNSFHFHIRIFFLCRWNWALPFQETQFPSSNPIKFTLD